MHHRTVMQNATKLTTFDAINQHRNKSPSNSALRRAQTLLNRGNHQGCRTFCEKLLRQGFANGSLLHLYGLALRGSGKLDEAAQKFTEALEFEPGNVAIINSLGVIFLDTGRYETAIELFKHSTKLDQKHYHSWINLGTALRAVDRLQAAELAFTCAHHVDRTQIEPMLSLADLLVDRRAYDEAAEFVSNLIESTEGENARLRLRQLQIAIRQENFDPIEAYYHEINRAELMLDEQAQLDNLYAYYLELTDKLPQAIEILKPWETLESTHQEHMRSYLGILYSRVGDMEKAIRLHQDILEDNPDHIASRYNLSLLQYRIGNLEEANQNYESRWHWKEFPSPRRQFDIPRWKGESLVGKKILVWREQGIGDEVRFASLLTDLADLGGSVTLEAAPKLAPVWKHSFPEFKIQTEGPLECRGDPRYKDFDYQIPMGSLAGHFRNSIEDFTTLQKPWIKRQTAREMAIREMIGIKPEEVLAGLCWRSSNRKFSSDGYYFSIEQLSSLAELPGVKWLNIQYDADREEIEYARKLGLDLHDFPQVDQMNDMQKACNLMGACDFALVPGVSVGDLTGGLGVPSAFCTASFDSIFLGTEHVPWYPNARAIKMQPSSTDKVIRDIIDNWAELRKWALATGPNHRNNAPSAANATSPSSGSDDFHEFDHPFPDG